VAGTVQVDAGKPYAVSPGRGLRWDALSAGAHAVKVLAAGQTWEETVEVRRDETTTARPVFGAPPGESRVNSLGMEFVPVPGTDVLFCKWETRVQDFEAFVKATGTSWSKPDFEQGPSHPAVNVSWDETKAFCKWLTDKERATGQLGPMQYYTLPQDWEWSVAVGLSEARTGTPKDKDGKAAGHPWGAQFPPPRGAGNYSQSLSVDAFEYTAPVGSFTANQHGLYDLGGNVWEWCEDFYDGISGARVLRGGSWDIYGFRCLLSSDRSGNDPFGRLGGYGFRCVLVGSSR
jgi:hypothetical protein